MFLVAFEPASCAVLAHAATHLGCCCCGRVGACSGAKLWLRRYAEPATEVLCTEEMPELLLDLSSALVHVQDVELAVAAALLLVASLTFLRPCCCAVLAAVCCRRQG